MKTGKLLLEAFRLRSLLFRHMVILTGLVIAVFGNTLWHGFVWDDTLFVPDGEVYRNFDLSAIFFSLRANGLEYLPVRDLSYALDCALWGKNPAGFHAANLFYYWLSVLAAYLLAARVVRLCRPESVDSDSSAPLTTAFLAAALFAVHPVNSEAVSFISCRNSLLSGLFLFLCSSAWLKYLEETGKRPLAPYVVALLFFLLSLFSKATGITLPLLLLCATWIFDRPLNRRHLLALTPFFALSAGAFLLFTTIARQSDVFLRQPVSADVVDKIVLAVQIPLFYLGKFLLPLGLSADYGSEQFARTAASPKVVGSLLLLLMMAFAGWHCRRKARLIAFAVAWFLAALIPLLHLFPTLPVVADRYALLPSFALCLLTAWAAVSSLKSRLFWVAVPVLLLLAVVAARQNLAWRSEKTLWENTLKVSPRSTTALAELGRIYFKEERNIGQAMEMYRRASEVDPLDPAFDLFQGHLFMMKRDYPRAIMAFKRAVQRDADNIEAVFNLGRAYESGGSVELAREQYRRAVTLPELDPRTNMRGRAGGYLQRLEGK